MHTSCFHENVTAIGKVKQLLNSLDYHGGNVKIEVNKQAFGMSHEVSQQVSMIGAKARQFLEKLTGIDNSKKTWGLCKKLCAITTNGLSYTNTSKHV